MEFDNELKELLIRHIRQHAHIREMWGLSDLLESREYGQEIYAQLTAQQEESIKELEDDIRSRWDETNFREWLGLILFHVSTMNPRQDEILSRAPSGWIKAAVMDALQHQETQKRELYEAAQGKKLPWLLGSTYAERVAKGELKRFTDDMEYEEYSRYIDRRASVFSTMS